MADPLKDQLRRQKANQLAEHYTRRDFPPTPAQREAWPKLQDTQQKGRTKNRQP